MGLPTASRCHGRHDPTSVMANRGHWMLLHSIGVLGTCKLHSKISKICEFGDQWMISWWSVDDQWMISWWLVDDQLMINGWSMDDQLMISWWSVDDQWMISWWSVDDQLMMSWWLERTCWVIWGCNGRNRRRALGQFGSRSSGRQRWNTSVSCHEKVSFDLKQMHFWFKQRNSS